MAISFVSQFEILPIQCAERRLCSESHLLVRPATDVDAEASALLLATRLRHSGDMFFHDQERRKPVFSHPQDAPAQVLTHLFGNRIYGVRIAQQLYYTFGGKAHGNGGADPDITLQIQVAAMHLDE